MDYAQDRYFYRCYSNRSAGQLRSGRYHDGHLPFTEKELLREFDIHRMRENKQPTALVSVTDRPFEALHRALAKHYYSYEDPGRSWIVIIRVPDGGNNNAHTTPGDLRSGDIWMLTPSNMNTFLNGKFLSDTWSILSLSRPYLIGELNG